MRQTTDHIAGSVLGHILLAEDDPVVQMVTTRVLEQAAYSVQVVDNGNEAINALKAEDYDLVLMDGSMPGMDGLEATRLIRDANSGVRQPTIPIIALTALTSRGDREDCIRAGMDDYVAKPVNPDLLIAAIKRCLEKSPDSKTETYQKDMPEKQAWDDSFLDTIIGRFIEEAPQVITELKAAIAEGDVQRLKDTGHRLKGSTDLLGLTNLSERSRALEQSAKTGEWLPAIRCADELISELQLLINAMADE